MKQGERPSAVAVSRLLAAVKIEPLSDSHCTWCGALKVPKRLSTQPIIRSRIISPEMPAVAVQPMTSRS